MSWETGGPTTAKAPCDGLLSCRLCAVGGQIRPRVSPAHQQTNGKQREGKTKCKLSPVLPIFCHKKVLIAKPMSYNGDYSWVSCHEGSFEDLIWLGPPRHPLNRS